MKAKLKVRNDGAGLGHFGAQRGDRKHNGIDYAVQPGDEILSPVNGMITKIGWPYPNGYGGFDSDGKEEAYTYVQVTDDKGLKHRVFYVKHILAAGHRVTTEDVIGVAQDVSLRYPSKTKAKKMTPHVHYEVLASDGSYVNPDCA